MGQIWGVESHGFLIEIPAQAKQSKQEHHCGGETISQDVFHTHLSIGATQHLNTNADSQFAPVGLTPDARFLKCQETHSTGS
jgi:hypothetical protein